MQKSFVILQKFSRNRYWLKDKMEEKKLIDIDRVIASKNPALKKLLPGFIVRYLKRITHQDAMNDFIIRNKNKTGLDFVDQVVKEYIKEVNFTGLEHLSADGRQIIASNHPLGGLDGIALMHVAGKVRKDIVFPVNDLLMNVENLRPLFIPVNKHGSNAQNVRIINDTFASGVMVLYFPAGLVSRKQKGVIRDLEWKKTFISYARRYRRDIVPAYIDGRNSNFFYRLANFRKSMGIKQNIEMLYLVDEMEKQKNQIINIIIGKPLSYEVFDKEYTDQQWAMKIKEHVYRLKDDPNRAFKP